MSWVQNTEPSGWVNFFSGIVSPPDYDALFNAMSRTGSEYSDQEVSDAYKAVEDSAWAFPMAIFFLACVVAVVSFFCVCCCAPKKCGRSCWPALGMCLAAMFLTFVGFGYFMATTEQGANMARDAYDTSLDHFDTSNATIWTMKTTLGQISGSLTKIRDGVDACAIPEDLKKTLSNMNYKTVSTKSQVDLLSEETDHILGHLQELDMDTTIDAGKAMSYAALLPLLFALLACGMQMFIMFSTVCCKEGSCWLRLEDIICFKIGSGVLVITILVIAFISAIELVGAMGISQACSLRGAQGQGNGDGFVLKYSHAVSQNSGDPAFYDNAYYFITGDSPTNAIDAMFANFSSSAQDLVSQAVVPLKKQFENDPTCREPVDDFENQVNKFINGLDEAIDLISAPQIYPFYDIFVHQATCGTVVNGLGVLSVLQIIVGLVLLPLMACFVHAYVAHKYFKDLKKNKGEDSGLMSDSDSDGSGSDFS
jgi:hypothetical protein